ncbi:uncharacterized protein HD556DRAFT_16560 [Suillus plorans]|uniref:Uncharacterized protein n=1 Tax=Suillus plorans TaxID=116603 RepID=A0A9P7E3P3_9AGAM|nr:uncharacterized protein HD556DRAFT_16560 [Suillus plorans]KAG1809955.1 hypothetical protein HD556DRAFT_16560 [Suillus plorans]
MNQGPACFSDLDEADGKLLEHARQAEEKEWRDEYSNVREILDFPLDDPTPKIPRGSSLSSSPLPSDGLSPPRRLLNTKRKAQEEDVKIDMANSEAAKRLRVRKAESDGTAKADVIPSWRRRLDARIREHSCCLPGLLVARRPDATDTSD